MPEVLFLFELLIATGGAFVAGSVRWPDPLRWMPWLIPLGFLVYYFLAYRHELQLSTGDEEDDGPGLVLFFGMLFIGLSAVSALVGRGVRALAESRGTSRGRKGF